MEPGYRGGGGGGGERGSGRFGGGSSRNSDRRKSSDTRPKGGRGRVSAELNRPVLTLCVYGLCVCVYVCVCVCVTQDDPPNMRTPVILKPPTERVGMTSSSLQTAKCIFFPCLYSDKTLSLLAPPPLLFRAQSPSFKGTSVAPPPP